ncbi:hypothetical protein BWD12_16110 [Leptospira santarosai serovar Bananal]|nr:hypothetical protein BWD11_05060 [Leptospira santarosai serovar Grippotyphosa]ONF77348.1 hypothetical protein BWD12_16110 [Leptospira santarosai serovar Bananal]
MKFSLVYNFFKWESYKNLFKIRMEITIIIVTTKLHENNTMSLFRTLECRIYIKNRKFRNAHS